MQKWASESEEIRVFPSFKFYLNGRELLHIIGTNEIRMKGLIKQHAVQNQDIATKKVRDLRTVAGKIFFFGPSKTSFHHSIFRIQSIDQSNRQIGCRQLLFKEVFDL